MASEKLPGAALRASRVWMKTRANQSRTGRRAPCSHRPVFWSR